MRHAETGGLADIPDLPYWRAAGWQPTDERPVEPDRLSDPVPAGTPEAPAAPGLFAVQSEEPAAAPESKKVSRRG